MTYAELDDYLEIVAEEIHLMTGLEANVRNRKIVVDTIAGTIVYEKVSNDIMIDVYRFIYHYGRRLFTYGLEQKLKLKKEAK